MEKLTYAQAYNKIIEAYFKDEIQILRKGFCFCGTLSPDSNWDWMELNIADSKYPYTIKEYGAMEQALFSPFDEAGLVKYMGTSEVKRGSDHVIYSHPRYEDLLFFGMSAALDVLKEIHRSRGENVDEDIPAFTKRELAKV